MNMREIPKWELASKVGAGVPAPVSLTRRQFARKAADATLMGAALSAGLWNPAMAQGHKSKAPVPIPGGTPALGGGFHVFGPTADGSFDPIDAEPEIGRAHV